MCDAAFKRYQESDVKLADSERIGHFFGSLVTWWSRAAREMHILCTFAMVRIWSRGRLAKMWYDDDRITSIFLRFQLHRVTFGARGCDADRGVKQTVGVS